MILVIGEILYDIFPSYNRIGGAPFNFAFHLKKLGFDVRFISRVGQDDLGKGILDFIASSGFDTDDIQTDPKAPTGRVKITRAKDGSHSFFIIKNTAYDAVEFTPHLKALCTSGPRMFYFGTLAQRTAKGRDLIRFSLDTLPQETLKFCDINLRPGCWTRSLVTESMAKTDILKLSQEELDIIVPDKTLSLEDRTTTLLTEPGPEQVILTRGKKGSLWASPRGIVHSSVPRTRPLGEADTVGAGDAYSAMAAAARLWGLGETRAMTMAHTFAAGICEIQGALPPDPDFYTPFLTRCHHDR